MLVSETNLPDLKLLARGKVRDVYEIDAKRLLIVATDRISAFDCVLPTPIARKGEVLTRISQFWFGRLDEIAVKHHLIATEIEAELPEMVRHRTVLRDRSMLVRRTKVFPVECVVRGYLSGSGWKDYVQTGAVCGHVLPSGLRESEKLPAPIFTPATKAASGHDENISEPEAAAIVGAENLARLKELSLKIYNFAADYTRERGIILADTKFEFGVDEDNEILLIDEVLTPDSSRFWDANNYQAGRAQPSFDKQFVRDYLESLAWNKQPPAPALPHEVATATSERYAAAFQIITNGKL